MDRRDFLRVTAATAGSGVLTGCIGSEKTISGDEYPAVDEWLTETDVGGSDDTYDGTILDRRGEDEVQIDVGVRGNGGHFAFESSAVVVSPGTTIQWVWTGEGGAHSVKAAPDEQINRSDYEFSSGNPIGKEGHKYTQPLDEIGIALYHCAGITGVHRALNGPASYGRRHGNSPDDVSHPYTLTFDPQVSMLSTTHYEPHLSLGMKGGVVVTD